MISLSNVSKYFVTTRGRHYVLRDATVTIGTTEKIGVVGRNGAGKSTLMRLLAGVDVPNSGNVERQGTISWPLGLATGLQPFLTGRENAKFACRIQGLTYDEVEPKLNFIHEFSEIGDYFDMPVRTFSSGMRARINFAIAMAFDFDFYIIDELTSVGDQAFRKKSREVFERKRETCGFAKVSHNLNELLSECQSGLILENGELTYFDTIADAVEVYKQSLEANTKHPPGKDVASKVKNAKKRPNRSTLEILKKLLPGSQRKSNGTRPSNEPRLVNLGADQPLEILKNGQDAVGAKRLPHTPAPMMPRKPTNKAKAPSH